MKIKAFKGLRFNSAVVGNPGHCIAPPYDVIDKALQQKLYEKSEYNVVRIIKGVSTTADNSNND